MYDINEISKVNAQIRVTIFNQQLLFFRSVVYLCLGTLLVKCFTCFTGLLIYARYHDCDPLASGRIERSDQILPFYVMDVAGKVPGLPGLFIAGVFCAALR